MKIRDISAMLFLVIICAAVVVCLPRVASAQKLYYVTKNTYPANKALSACAPGFHMASIAELANPSALHYYYNYSQAYIMSAGQGQGPPTGRDGWIYSSQYVPHSGHPFQDCREWTSNSSNDSGNYAWFNVMYPYATMPEAVMLLLQTTTAPCDNIIPVWCVQNGM
jgi:hypothetical protein